MLEVAIFSYNRGAYVANCLASVRRNLPGARVRVYDDGSDAPETLAYLDTLGDLVIRPDRARAARLGGLYGNMQAALDAAEGEFLLFLQDDVQVVRAVTAEELDALRGWFDAHPDAAFVSPVFLKGARRASRRRLLRPVPGWRGYTFATTDARRVVDMFYNDMTVAHVGRLRAVGWRFQPSERANAERARDAGFAQMMVMGDPFVFFCPEVPFFRYKDQTLGARWADRILGRDVRRFTDMDPSTRAAFLARPLTDLPFAEDYLTPENPHVRRPFVFKSVNARWYTRALNKLELALRPRR
ncbi:glycosyltransferase [Actibacterium sp. D379-3]